MHKMPKPLFIMSLDVESAWGFLFHPQHRALSLLKKDVSHGRENIELLKKLFDKYNIPATWAIVGYLFSDKAYCEKTIRPDIPQFKEGYLDWNFFESICEDSLYHDQSLIDSIQSTSVEHEIGLHGFFHIPFSNCSVNTARSEIKMGLGAATDLGLKIKSFVYPENKIDHIDILKDHGIKIYRSKNVARYDSNQKFPICKLNALADQLIARPVMPKFNQGICELPSSTNFCDPRLPFSLLFRSKIGLHRTIKSQGIFHVWLHPWSLIEYPPLANDLEKLLKTVSEMMDENKLQVITMGELAEF